MLNYSTGGLSASGDGSPSGFSSTGDSGGVASDTPISGAGISAGISGGIDGWAISSATGGSASVIDDTSAGPGSIDRWQG